MIDHYESSGSTKVASRCRYGAGGDAFSGSGVLVRFPRCLAWRRLRASLVGARRWADISGRRAPRLGQGVAGAFLSLRAWQRLLSWSVFHSFDGARLGVVAGAVLLHQDGESSWNRPVPGGQLDRWLAHSTVIPASTEIAGWTLPVNFVGLLQCARRRKPRTSLYLKCRRVSPRLPARAAWTSLQPTVRFSLSPTRRANSVSGSHQPSESSAVAAARI